MSILTAIDGAGPDRRFRRVAIRRPCIGCDRPTPGRYSPYDGFEDPMCARCLAVVDADWLTVVPAAGVVA